MPRLFLCRSLAAACVLPLAPSAIAQCAGFGTPQSASEPAAELVSLVGRGETRTSGAPAWQPAVLAQKLGGGADMRTLALSSAALLLADRTQIRMSANAELRLCDAQPERSLLELIAGRLWARTKRSPANLQLQTPAALAVVRGTDWDVQVEGSGRTTFTVLSGQVEFSNAYGRVDLGPAEQGIAVPGQAPTKRLLVNPRERVQWVMANPVDARRWVEFQGDALAPELAAVRADLDAGALPQARERLLSLRSSGAHEAVVALVLADLAGFDGRLEDAVQDLDLAWQRTGDPRLAARRAELLLALDRPQDARVTLDQALARSESTASSDLLLADGDWYRLAGQGDEALARYRAGVARAAGDMQRANALGHLGRALQERGDLAAAREALEEAVTLSPKSASLLGVQATAATEALRLQEAHKGFDAALALQADDYESLAGAGFLALRRGEPEAARQLLLKALVIEPRYARAQVWLAVAEYTLGAEGAALDALQRARQADPRDPLAWQVEAVMRNDSGEPAQAISAAREALVRLPWLKSLNALSTDSQGSANLGKALGDIGLENWARAYASASYYPLWAGSHFFLADRYESDFNRKSELFQGYLSDPTVFGASDLRAPLLLSTGSEWSVGLSAERNALRHNATADVGYRGFSASPTPTAWLLRADDVQMWPRDGPASTQYRLRSPGIDLALGMRPSERLALFGLYGDTELRYRYPDGLDFGNGIAFNDVARSRTRRADLGASWRWSADSQTWLKVHKARQTQSLVLDDATYGPQDYRFASDERGVFLRHTLVASERQLSFGWERVARDTGSALSDAEIVTPRTNTERYDMPWVAAQWQAGKWAAQAEAYWPMFSTAQSDRFTDPQDQDLLDPVLDSAKFRRRLLPRFGLSYRFGPGRALHFAYQESLRAPGTHTLAPVSTGAIAVDNQYLLAGSFARKKAMQLDWELGPRSFLGASLSGQSIANPVAATGRLFAQNTSALFDNVGTLAPPLLNAQTSLNTYEETPIFDRGTLTQASVGLNQLLGARWGLLGQYTYTHSRNTGATYEGNLLPGFARHVLLGQATWRQTARSFALLRLTWRGERYADQANLNLREPGWSLALAQAWQSPDRHWSVTGTLQTALSGERSPTVWVLVRWRGN